MAPSSVNPIAIDRLVESAEHAIVALRQEAHAIDAVVQAAESEHQAASAQYSYQRRAAQLREIAVQLEQHISELKLTRAASS